MKLEGTVKFNTPNIIVLKLFDEPDDVTIPKRALLFSEDGEAKVGEEVEIQVLQTWWQNRSLENKSVAI